MNGALQDESAKQEILHRLHEYCWGYDQNDMDLLGSVFTDDALSTGVVDKSDISWGPWQGRHEIVAALAEIRNSQSDRRRHVLSSYVFDTLCDTTATARAYVSIFSYSVGQPPTFVSVGEYSLKAVRGDFGWRLARLEEVLDAPF